MFGIIPDKKNDLFTWIDECVHLADDTILKSKFDQSEFGRGVMSSLSFIKVIAVHKEQRMCAKIYENERRSFIW